MHAAGHALLAGAGGVLARALAGGGAPTDGGSFQILSALGAGDPMLGIAIVGLFAAIAKMVGGVFAGWAEARVAGEVGSALRLEVLDDVLGVNSLRAPRQRDHGEAHLGDHARPEHAVGANIAHVASLTTHVTDVEKGIVHGVFAEARAVLQLLPLGLLLAILAPRLAGSAAFALGAFAVLVLVARRALKRNHARASRESEALLGAADEAVRHADLWATYGAESRVRVHVGQLGRSIIATTARLRARTALLSGTSEVLGALALVLTLALVTAGAIGGVSRGAIVPFAIAFFMAYKPLRELVEARLARARAEEALARITMNQPALGPSSRGPSSHRPAGPARAHATRSWPLAALTVTELVTTHGSHSPLSFRVAPGTITAIVGPTGIGKTSLLRALLGLDTPSAGTIAWGSEDVTQHGVGPFERPFAWVPQDAPLLGDTLVANVVLGHASGEDESVAASEAITARALTDLGALGLAESLGDATLATGRVVSGGERQWIAVARALATRLPVLLLDEPTSSLDGAAQERMLRAIAGLRGKRSVVIVTHRTEPLRIADRVVRLETPVAPAPTSHRENAQDRPGGHTQDLRAKELPIEHIGAVVAADVLVAAVAVAEEAQRELARERVDVARAD